MTLQDRPYADVAATATTILQYYVDTFGGRTDLEFLAMVLDGGMVPEDVVAVLRPIIWKALTSDPSGMVSIELADLNLFEACYSDVIRLMEKRSETQKTLQKAFAAKPWLNIEKSLATRFGLKFLSNDARSLELYSRAVDMSHFSVIEIIEAVSTEGDLLTQFGGQWYADCDKRDYGEEWDPLEGNQQEDNPAVDEVLGMEQGFLLTYTIFYLYASRMPKSLLIFLKRYKVPHASKVTKDIMRIYRKVNSVQ